MSTLYLIAADIIMAVWHFGMVVAALTLLGAFVIIAVAHQPQPTTHPRYQPPTLDERDGVHDPRSCRCLDCSVTRHPSNGGTR